MSGALFIRARVTKPIECAEKIDGTPTFVFYAIADGLFSLLTKVGKGIADRSWCKDKSANDPSCLFPAPAVLVDNPEKWGIPRVFLDNA